MLPRVLNGSNAAFQEVILKKYNEFLGGRPVSQLSVTVARLSLLDQCVRFSHLTLTVVVLFTCFVLRNLTVTCRHFVSDSVEMFMILHGSQALF